MSDGGASELNRGMIVVRPSKNLLRSKYRFVAVRSDGSTILQGSEFTSATFSVGNQKSDLRQLALLLNELALIGWQAVETGGKHWYERRLYYRGEGQVPVQSSGMPRQGMSVESMWKWSLFVLILLFAICVFLAFTAQLEIRPAT